MLDSSGSLRERYSQIKSFIQKFTSNLDISHDGVHVGVVTFSFYAKLSIKFSDFTDVRDFGEAVQRIPLMASTSRIDRALKVVDQELFSEANGARLDNNVTKMLVLLTDGTQTQDKDAVDPGKIGQLLRQKDIHILCVGIGDGIDRQELTHISGDSARVYIASDLDELMASSFIAKVLVKCCETGNFFFYEEISLATSQS